MLRSTEHPVLGTSRVILNLQCYKSGLALFMELATTKPSSEVIFYLELNYIPVANSFSPERVVRDQIPSCEFRKVEICPCVAIDLRCGH